MVEFGENETKKEAWWEVMSHCDVFHGMWVKDDANPMYEPGSCPFINESFDCYQNGRPDNEILLKTRIEFLRYLEERFSRKRDWWMRREYEVKDVFVVDGASALPEEKANIKEVESQKENIGKHKIEETTQDSGMTVETFSDNQSLLQQKEMHMDMNCKKDLEALTSEIEDGWKHVKKKKGKRKNNEETNQEMMDLNIENNDVNEDKDHEQ
ncbi:hypothetical protein H5410_046386 [Solanum commersonii]|uniref:Trichome birefringence-like N-terminal domain-containing protein n=1 Tax=Solanum commersonii TaxID=4109 RepID=A0A9J5XGC2_SOLCO|nr:hypothetical protein H5410_046386 [Solanum commersonii]